MDLVQKEGMVTADSMCVYAWLRDFINCAKLYHAYGWGQCLG